jgi:hypothetical protein
MALGNHNDPLKALYGNKFKANGPIKMVLVEPQPAIVTRLRDLTVDMPHVHVLNAAVCGNGSVDGMKQTVSFYEIDMEKVAAMKAPPIFFVKNGQVASLNKSHIMKYKPQVPEIESLIREIQVKCLSFRKVLQRYHVASRELAGLVIDAEGHDSEILATIDWETDDALRPQLLIFEWRSMLAEQRLHHVQRLEQHGYNCSSRVDYENYWCIHIHATDGA